MIFYLTLTLKQSTPSGLICPYELKCIVTWQPKIVIESMRHRLSDSVERDAYPDVYLNKKKFIHTEIQTSIRIQN
jgi:hypothetical protein